LQRLLLLLLLILLSHGGGGHVLVQDPLPANNFEVSESTDGKSGGRCSCRGRGPTAATISFCRGSGSSNALRFLLSGGRRG
jgi:hypothetical protein